MPDDTPELSSAKESTVEEQDPADFSWLKPERGSLPLTAKAWCLDFSSLVAEKLADHMPGTRDWLLRSFSTYLDNPGSSSEGKADGKGEGATTKNQNLFWLLGSGGTGKTVTAVAAVRQNVVRSFFRHIFWLTVGADAVGSWLARLRYVDAGITQKQILGPPRQSERRAENDLATLREAARAQKTWPEQVAAMQQAAQVLRESAQRENRVARGVAQYEAQKQAHKAEDSDPETSGDEDDGADDDLDDVMVAKIVADLPPLRARPPPPVDPNDANVQLACFRFSLERPETLEAILLARADPNLIVGDGTISPLRKAMLYARENKDAARMRELLLEHGADESAYERRRWEERCAADAGEAAWLQNFHRSA